MALVLTTAPAIEPVTLAEAKAHLRIDGSAEDTLIASLIITSRLHIESAMGLAMITQSWSSIIDAWPPGREVALPLRPVQSIAAVRLYAADGTIETLPADTYLLDGAATPARLVRHGAAPWPAPTRSANGIEIALVAGFGATVAHVPAPIRQAVLLLVAHWHEHREPVQIGAPGALVPAMVSDLLQPYRLKRL
jgi:uncharacterized phiE125 gp8 family phage protein